MTLSDLWNKHAHTFTYLSGWTISSWRGTGGSLMYPVCPVGKRPPLCCTVSYENPRWSACTVRQTSRSRTGTRLPFSRLWWIPESPSCNSSSLGLRSRSRTATFSLSCLVSWGLTGSEYVKRHRSHLRPCWDEAVLFFFRIAFVTGAQSGGAYLSASGPSPSPPLSFRHSSACSIERQEKRSRLSAVRQSVSFSIYIITVINRAPPRQKKKKIMNGMQQQHNFHWS